MPRSERNAERITVVAPTAARARSAVAAVFDRLPGARLLPTSLASLAASGLATGRLVLCPGGLDVEQDLAFVSRVRARALWPAPEADLHGAIAGLLGHDLPDSSAPVSKGGSLRKVALLLEGRITPARTRAALRSDTRHWIVEDPGCVRLSGRQLDTLRGRGVRWSALNPVRVVALLASPALAAARRRWQRLLPAETPVWVWKKD
jgi:hypothetical protein